MADSTLIYALDLVGTASFAFSGVLRGFHRKPDPVGMTVLATATAVGGGMVRDVILDRPASMLADPAYLSVILAAVAVSMLVPGLLRRRRAFFKYFDAVGLGIFSAIGGTLAVEAGLNPLSVLFVAAITGTGGGIIRDVLLREVPLVLYKEVYASAVVAGAAGLVLIRYLGGGVYAGFFTALAVTLVIRVLAIWRNWSLPRFRGQARARWQRGKGLGG